MSFEVVTRHPSMISYVDHLQRKNAEALSFYPKSVFEREAEKRRLFLGLLNGEPCGYLYAGATGINVRIHQVCIQYDARRRLYGAELVGAVEKYADAADASVVTLRCGFDLEANDFWSSIGYLCVGHQDGGVRRMRKINIWRKELQPALIPHVAVEPLEGTTSAALWSANKERGLVTQFHRGKAMRRYRHLLIAKGARP